LQKLLKRGKIKTEREGISHPTIARGGKKKQLTGF